MASSHVCSLAASPYFAIIHEWERKKAHSPLPNTFRIQLTIQC